MPWELSVDDTSYTSNVGVGDTIEVVVTITNPGSGKNPATVFNFSELDKYADILDCTPECAKEDLPGLGPSAVMGGVTPGDTLIATINFVATTVGAVDWTLCVYATPDYGNQVWCGDGTTAIR